MINWILCGGFCLMLCLGMDLDGRSMASAFGSLAPPVAAVAAGIPASPSPEEKPLETLEWMTAGLGSGALLGYGLALLGLTWLALPALLLGLGGLGLAWWLRRKHHRRGWRSWLGLLGGGVVLLVFLVASGLVLFF